MPPESEGGVFISTEKIYDLLRESIDRTNERMTEIRSDIQRMNAQNQENREDIRELGRKVEKVEEEVKKKKDRIHPSLVSAFIAGPIAIAGILAPLVIK